VQSKRIAAQRKAAETQVEIPARFDVAADVEGPSYEELVETEGRPRLRHWLNRVSNEGILAHAAVVCGAFPAVSEGDVVVVTEPKPDAPERFRFTPTATTSRCTASSCSSPRRSTNV
jgi:5-methyltetrahydrofolate--homocysteine methyltransferase